MHLMPSLMCSICVFMCVCVHFMRLHCDFVCDMPLPPLSPAGPQRFYSFVAALCFFSFFSLFSSFCTGEHNVWFNIIFQSLKAAGQGLLTELFRSS